MKQKLLLLGAVFFGFLAFMLSYNQLQYEKRRIIGTAETVLLVQLKNTKTAGEELRDTDITRVEVKRLPSKALANREILWKDRYAAIGRQLETTVNAGQILLHTDLKPINQRHGFNSIIPSGQRAISIPVDTTGAVTNLVGPNDNVDVIGTFRFPDLRGDSSLDTVTLTILQNVKVLAVGNRWGAQQYADPNSMNRSYSTVTLLVWPEEVEMLIFASQKGRLALSLRNFDDARIDRELEGKSVNFKELEKNIPSFNEQRRKRQQYR